MIWVGFPAPAWSHVVAGLRPDAPQVEDHQIGLPDDGWQQGLSATEQAMWPSQGGPLSGVPFSFQPVLALESATARICREAGARVGTNVMAVTWTCSRRILTPGGWRCDGLPLFHSAQLAIDTTMVSTVRRDGLPRPRSVRDDGAALSTARCLKERTFPVGRARLVVLACEGRWSGEALPQQARARAAWLLRWRTMRPSGGV